MGSSRFIEHLIIDIYSHGSQGAAHAVDSSELAFRLAAIGAVKQGMCSCVSQSSTALK